jgi:hypothetical protein
MLFSRADYQYYCQLHILLKLGRHKAGIRPTCGTRLRLHNDGADCMHACRSTFEPKDQLSIESVVQSDRSAFIILLNPYYLIVRTKKYTVYSRRPGIAIQYCTPGLMILNLTSFSLCQTACSSSDYEFRSRETQSKERPKWSNLCQS